MAMQRGAKSNANEYPYEVAAWDGNSEPYIYRFTSRGDVRDFLNEQKPSYFTQTFRVGFSNRSFRRNHLLTLDNKGLWHPWR